MTIEIHIETERCKGCRVCIEVCQADVLDIAERPNSHGHHPPLVKNIDKCTNCGLCEMLCPDFAIHILEDQEVTHQ